MKRFLSVVLVATLFSACNESDVNVKAEADSLNTKLENISEKIEDKAGQVWDSTKEKASDLKDKAAQKWDSVKTSNRDKDTANQ